MLTGLFVLAGASQPGLAQEKKEECVCEPAFGRVQVLPRGGEGLVWMGNRARLGVLVHTEANPETDRYGALIDGVTKGGPAEKAGLEQGDIITKLNDESLLQGGEAFDEDESAPGMRLVERARKLEHGNTVRVEYRRDGKTSTAEIVVGEFDNAFAVKFDDFAGNLEDSGRLRGMVERLRTLPEVLVEGPETFALRLGASLPGLELVSLNPDLGDYFGTADGVLVVSVPKDSKLSLKAGDVIKAIDGRTVRSPSHAMRILRSYDSEEKVSFQVFRQKKERTVEGTVSELTSAPSMLRIQRK
jgi:S1-C subfamily serine protease